MRSPASAGARRPQAHRGTRNATRDASVRWTRRPVYAPEIPAVGESVVGESAVGERGGSAAAGDPTPAPGAPRTNPPQSIRLRVLAARAPVRLTAATRCSPTRTTKPRRRCCPRSANSTLSGAQALPELHLDVHVFATKPSERFVYINMRKYREGATLEEGPLLERIRRDGVVLNFQGVRFVLPRQQ